MPSRVRSPGPLGHAYGPTGDLGERALAAPASPLVRLHARIREGTGRAHTLAYFDHRTRPKLIKLLEFAALPELEEFLERLRACTRYSPCWMFACPNCGPKLKAEQKDEALNRIVARLGRFPQHFEISFITVDGPTVELDPKHAAAALKRFRAQIVKFQQRKARSTSWYGFFDVSAAGLLHWHGVVIHSDVPRNALDALLRASFPGEDQTRVRDGLENLDTALSGVSA
jgi:hypothetical protein